MSEQSRQLPRVATAEEAPRTPAKLFRQEVMDAQSAPKLGTVLLDPRPSARIAVIASSVCALLVLLFLFLGSFTRKETMNGWLVPLGGIVSVVPSQAGVVKTIDVKEGERVRKGQKLMTVATDLKTEKFGSTSEAVLRGLSKQHDSLAEQLDNARKSFDEQLAEQRQRLSDMKSELAVLQQQIDFQRQRVSISGASLDRAKAMLGRAIISRTAYEKLVSSQLEDRSNLATLERQYLQLKRETATLTSAIQQLPQQRAVKESELAQQIAALDQSIAEAESRRETVFSATQDGVVTAIQVSAGSTASPGVPAMIIVPGDTPLRAELFAPSRAVGFLKPGADMLLQYQAFPYQNFGFYRAKIETVSQTSVSTAELPPNLSGLTEFYGSNAPVYRVYATLERQTVTTYGRQTSLQAGMQVKAEALIEKHSLIEWLLYPILARTGAWTQ